MSPTVPKSTWIICVCSMESLGGRDSSWGWRTAWWSFRCSLGAKKMVKNEALWGDSSVWAKRTEWTTVCSR